MTEFEGEVAKALAEFIETYRLASTAEAVAAALAPRVAAAIEVVAKARAADIEHEYGGGRVPGGAHYEETLARSRDEALAALRGGP